MNIHPHIVIGGHFGLSLLPSHLKLGRLRMFFYIASVAAIVILILHFSGWLRRNNLEWMVLVAAVSIFPAVIWGR